MRIVNFMDYFLKQDFGSKYDVTYDVSLCCSRTVVKEILSEFEAKKTIEGEYLDVISNILWNIDAPDLINNMKEIDQYSDVYEFIKNYVQEFFEHYLT